MILLWLYLGDLTEVKSRIFLAILRFLLLVPFFCGILFMLAERHLNPSGIETNQKFLGNCSYYVERYQPSWV